MLIDLSEKNLKKNTNNILVQIRIGRLKESWIDEVKESQKEYVSRSKQRLGMKMDISIINQIEY